MRMMFKKDFGRTKKSLGLTPITDKQLKTSEIILIFKNLGIHEKGSQERVPCFGSSYALECLIVMESAVLALREQERNFNSARLIKQIH